MSEELIKFETAKLAKEKGFNEPCLNYYGYNISVKDEIDKINICTTTNKKESNSFYKSEACSAPTQSLLQKWLRDKHNIEVEPYRTVKCTTGEKYGCQGEKWIDDESSEDLFNIYKDTYEEALETGLFEALKLI